MGDYPDAPISIEALCLLDVLKTHHRGRGRAEPRDQVRGETFNELQRRDPFGHGDKHGSMNRQLSDRHFRDLRVELLKVRSKEWPKGVTVCSSPEVGYWLGLNGREGEEAATALEKKAYNMLAEAKAIREAHDAKYGRQEDLL